MECQRVAHEVVRGVDRAVELTAESAACHSPVAATLGVDQVVDSVS